MGTDDEPIKGQQSEAISFSDFRSFDLATGTLIAA